MDNSQFKWEELLSKYHWEHKKIGDIAFSINAGALSSKHINSSEQGNFPAIRLRNINRLKSPFIHECDTRLDIREVNKRGQ